MAAQQFNVKAETDTYHDHRERFCRFLLQIAQRLNFAATSTLTFREACAPKQIRALALLVADAAWPFPVPAGLLRTLSDTITMRRSIQQILESKATPAPKLARSLPHPQSTPSGSPPSLEKRFAAPDMPHRQLKPLWKSGGKAPSKLGFAALLSLGQRENARERTTAATSAMRPVLGTVIIAEDWLGPIDWYAGRNQIWQPGTPRRNATRDPNGWPSPDHPFYFDARARVPGSTSTSA
ncbi:hypothetical protein LTR95_001502 [Oleoguttula sp. CCFEE 5521]